MKAMFPTFICVEMAHFFATPIKNGIGIHNEIKDECTSGGVESKYIGQLKLPHKLKSIFF